MFVGCSLLTVVLFVGIGFTVHSYWTRLDPSYYLSNLLRFGNMLVPHLFKAYDKVVKDFKI
jgi:hypothetical protein